MRIVEEQQQQKLQQQLQQQRLHPTYFTMPDWSKGSSDNNTTKHNRSASSAGPYYIPSTQPPTESPIMARPRSSDSDSSDATMTPSINARQETSYHHPIPVQIQRPASAASIARPASTTPSVSTMSDEALRDRIERLRAGGWQRKRFDNRRYEALREQVLGELGV
ncbi:hypothetical protein PG994_012414 [Apiospora phragmitis]|uniref:Uncharacterized protein n=1 Tax=Apiospora phragmitis TaxID=2905665 RepID=A0ABR1TVK5_9PEZI